MGLELLFIVFGFLIGIGIGYFGFYMMYENAKLIDELRKNFSKTKSELEAITDNFKALQEENKILRDQTKKLLSENDDLQKIVSELSIYSLHIKNGGEKARELAQILGIYNKEIEEKLEKVLGKEYKSEGIGWNKS